MSGWIGDKNSKLTPAEMEELDSLHEEQCEEIMQYMDRVYSGEEQIPAHLHGTSSLNIAFRNSMQSQTEHIWEARKTHDLDFLRVNSRFHPSDPVHGLSLIALRSVVKFLRIAGYHEVAPLMNQWNISQAALLHNAFRANAEISLCNNSSSNFQAVILACALGTVEAADYMLAHPVEIAQMAQDRELEDHDAVVAIVESMMEAQVTALATGIL